MLCNERLPRGSTISQAFKQILKSGDLVSAISQAMPDKILEVQNYYPSHTVGVSSLFFVY